MHNFLKQHRFKQSTKSNIPQLCFFHLYFYSIIINVTSHIFSISTLLATTGIAKCTTSTPKITAPYVKQVYTQNDMIHSAVWSPFHNVQYCISKQKKKLCLHLCMCKYICMCEHRIGLRQTDNLTPTQQ